MRGFFSTVSSRGIEVDDVRASLGVGCVRNLNNQRGASFSDGRIFWERAVLNCQMPGQALCKSASREPLSKKPAP